MENDFVIVLNDLQINCNKKYISTNFSDFYRNSNSFNNQISIQIDGGNDFYEVTKNIFQGNNYDITNDNFYYLMELSQKLNSARLQTKLNSFAYKRECDDKQIGQHPNIQFLVEVSTLIRQLSINNYEDSSSLIKQKLTISIENIKKSNTSSQSSDSQKNSEGSENDEDNSEQDENDESEDEDEKENTLSLKNIGIKELIKLFYFEIVNTLSIGFNSLENLHEHQDKVALIVQLIKELDTENQTKLKSKDSSLFFSNFINYVIKKYKKNQNQQNSLNNYRQETQYLIHYLLSKKFITLSQILQENSPVMLYFLEFYTSSEIKEFFSNHEQIIEFLKNEMKESNTKSKPKTRGKKKESNKEEENKDNIFVNLLSENIQNGLIKDNELINIFLNDDIGKFTETFNDESIDSYKLPKEISNISCLSALNDCSVIELAAFLGSESIFEYLNTKMLNHEIKEQPNLFSYVIIGQHPQIIKIFLSKITSESQNLILSMLSFCNDHHFDDTYNMIINSIDNCPKPTYKEIDQFAKKRVSRSYFDMIPSLLQEGVTTNVLLNLFCRTKNLIGIEYMLSFSHIDVNTPYKDLSPLEYCINNKNGYACVLLLKNDFINFQTIDNKSANGETILHTSCLYGLSKPVSFLLRKHLYDVNLPTKDGVCPIHYACLSGDYDTVLAVIRTKKAHIRTKVKEGVYKKRTALHFACCSGNSHIITLLFDSDEKFKVDDVDVKNRTPIIYAIKGDFVDCVYVLLEQEGIDINQEYKGNNLLQYACIKNKNNVFDVLLNSIVFDQNQTCKDGRTILVVAIENKNIHILKSILNKYGRSVNVNLETSDGKTPLIKACEMGNIEMVKLLLDHELIDVNKASKDGYTPFMAAARSGNSDLLKLLLDSEDIDIYFKNKQGMSAIHFAFFSEHIEAVKFLLPLFKDRLNDLTTKGETLFQIAFKKGKVQLTKLLIDNPDVDVNICDKDGMTAFLSAAQLGNLDFIKALIESNKCEINRKTNNGENAFFVAIRHQNYDVVKFFIDLYAENNTFHKSKSKNKTKKQIKNENSYIDITAKTNDDKTALFVALKTRNTRILTELINCQFIDINETSKGKTFLCKLVKKMCQNNSYYGFSYKNIFQTVLKRDDLDINLRSQGYSDLNMLHIACKSPNHNIRLVNEILEIKGIDINADSPEGTPLYLLIKYQNEYFKEKPKTNVDRSFRYNFNSNRTSLNKMVDILKSKNEYSDSEDEEDNKKGNNQGFKFSFKLPPAMSKMQSLKMPTQKIQALQMPAQKIQALQMPAPKMQALQMPAPKTPVTKINTTKTPEKTTTMSFNTTYNVKRINDYWCDFLKFPKLNINKGGNPNCTDTVFRMRTGFTRIITKRNKTDDNRKQEKENENENTKILESPLELAIAKNYTKIIEALIEIKGININVNNNINKRTPLHLAIDNIDINLINKILEKKDVKVNIQDMNGNTPLLFAIQKYSPKLTDFILNFLQRNDVIKTINTQNKVGTSPFLASVLDTDAKIFNTLLGLRGVDLRCQDNKGQTALHLLVNNFRQDDLFNRVKAINEKCPSLLNVMDNNDKTALFSSIVNYNQNDNANYLLEMNNVISYLLDQDDIDLTLPEDLYPEENEEEEKNEEPEPKLKPKSKSKKEKPTELDVDKNKYKGTRYTSLLHIACSKSIPQIVSQLIPLMISFYEQKEKKENLFVHKNKRGNTVLNIACSERDVDTIDVLIKYIKDPDNNIDFNDPVQFDINTLSSSNLAPLHAICSIKETVKSLLILDDILSIDSIDINLKSPESDQTALHFACSSSNTKVVEKLIDYGSTVIDPNLFNKNDMTPLLIAVSRNAEGIVNCLLKLGTVDVNLPIPKIEKTPLYLACENSSTGIVELLMSDERTDPNIPITSNGNTPLHAACENRNERIVSLLLNNEKTNPNAQNTKTLKTPLIYSVETNKGGIASILLTNEKTDINIVDKYSNTALHYACMNNNKKSVDLLINFSPELIDPNVYNSDKKTPLIIAVSNNNSPVVKRLLRISSLDVNLPIPDSNKSPLFITCEQWNFKLASHLLNDSRIDPNYQIMPSGKTPLMHSIEKYKADLFNIILSNPNIDLDVADSQKLTVFHYACRIGQLDFIKSIFDKKCQIGGMSLHDYLNAQDENGSTPLHYACSSNNKEAILFLLNMNIMNSNQVDINIRDKNEMTPFDIYISNPSGIVDKEIYDSFLSENNQNKIETKANFQQICENGHYKMVDFMLSNLLFDANNNENKKKKMTLLHILCQSQKVDLIQELLAREDEFNVDMNAVDIENKTALHHAVINSFDNQIVHLLLSTNKSDINAKDKYGRTALHYACENGRTSIIEELLNYEDEIDINAQDSTGSTILHDLAKSVHFDLTVIETVLSSKLRINPNLKDVNGNTPLHIGCQRENNLFVSNFIKLCPVEIDINAINMKFETPFFIVCKNNDFIIYNIMLESNLWDKIDFNLASPIYVAAIKSNLYMFERMLDIPGIDLNCNKNEVNLQAESENGQPYVREFDFRGYNLMHILSSLDSPELLNKLIQMEQYDINESAVGKSFNGTPLIIALKNNRLKNLYLLFEHYGSGLDLSIYDSRGKAAVHYCFELENNGMNILQELIKIDDRIINMETLDAYRSTPLMIAFQKNKIDCALLLLQQPMIDVFCINKNQNSIVHFAAEQSRKDIIDFILTKIKTSSNDMQDIIDFINIDNDQGETALLIACKKASIYVVRSLIDTFKDSLDFTIADENGITPFIAAVETMNNELIHLLLTNVNCTSTIDLSVPINENNDYIAQLMAKNSNLENFRLLIEETSSHSSNLNLDFINVKNNNGDSLISIAIDERKYDIFDYLCETQNPDLNILMDNNTPLLFEAVQKYDFNIFKSILYYGSFNVNQKFNGMSLLHYAVQSHNDSLDKVNFLIKQDGIDVNCTTDKGGLTPLHLAVKNKNRIIVEALLSLNEKIDINKQNSRHKSPKDMAKNRFLRKLFNQYDERVNKKDNKENEEEEEDDDE